MKAVLISIRPKWCEKIISGEKTIEERKTRPKLNPPLKCYIYKCGNGKIIGEFLCDQIININGAERIPSDVARPTCLEPAELHQYLGAATGFGWHISNLKIYDTPRELDDFRRACKNDWWCESCAMYSEYNGTCGNGSLQIRRPPQSWCYVEGDT
jgi:predicted transcriptional regulator